MNTARKSTKIHRNVFAAAILLVSQSPILAHAADELSNTISHFYFVNAKKEEIKLTKIEITDLTLGGNVPFGAPPAWSEHIGEYTVRAKQSQQDSLFRIKASSDGYEDVDIQVKNIHLSGLVIYVSKKDNVVWPIVVRHFTSGEVSSLAESVDLFCPKPGSDEIEKRSIPLVSTATKGLYVIELPKGDYSACAIQAASTKLAGTKQTFDLSTLASQPLDLLGKTTVLVRGWEKCFEDAHILLTESTLSDVQTIGGLVFTKGENGLGQLFPNQTVLFSRRCFNGLYVETKMMRTSRNAGGSNYKGTLSLAGRYAMTINSFGYKSFRYEFELGAASATPPPNARESIVVDVLMDKNNTRKIDDISPWFP